MGQGKYHVVVGGGQQLRHPAFYPGIPFHTPAVWAVPVAATVVPVTPVPTVSMVTPGKVIAFGGGMACGKIGEHSPAEWVEALDMRMSEQGLERFVIFHPRANQEVKPAFPYAAWSGAGRSWWFLSWSGREAA